MSKTVNFSILLLAGIHHKSALLCHQFMTWTVLHIHLKVVGEHISMELIAVSQTVHSEKSTLIVITAMQ